MIARRAMAPDHLWQDPGLRDRDELSAPLERHFRPLARQNRDNTKRKRFLQRQLCEAEGVVLCAAPVCTACNDFNRRFGAETSVARPARAREVIPAPSLS